MIEITVEEMARRVVEMAREKAPGDNVFLAGAGAAFWKWCQENKCEDQFEEAWKKAGGV